MNIAAPLRSFSHKYHRLLPPLCLSRTQCEVLAALSCVCLFSQLVSVRAEPLALPVVKSSSSVTLGGIGDAAQGALLNLRVGRTMSFPLPESARYSIAGDAALIEAVSQDEVLTVKAVGAGRIILTIELPVKDGEIAVPQKYSLRIVSDSVVTGTAQEVIPVGNQTDNAMSAPGIEQAVITAGVGATQIPPRSPAYTTKTTGVGSAVASTPLQTETLRSFTGLLRITPPESARYIDAQVVTQNPKSPAAGTITAGTKIATRTDPNAKANSVAKATAAAQRLNSVISSSDRAPAMRLARADKRPTQIIASAQLAPAQLAPDLPELQPIPKSSSGIDTLETPFVDPPGSAMNTTERRTASRVPGLTEIPEGSTENADVVVSPPMLPPNNLSAVGASYPLRRVSPTDMPLPPDYDATARRPLYRVTQGMARILAFKSNILSVFFSDDNVMDARAINARTIGVTGKGPGRSTLAVFLSRYPNDVVGRAVIYNIEVYPAIARTVPIGFTDPVEAETAIRTALNDPRVRVSVLQRPDGSLVAQLSGGLRDRAEVDASVATASLFVPNVISSLYVDPQAPSLETALRGPAPSGDQALQTTLRSILGNETIELVPLPNGTALKATVDTAAQAETILSLLPTLDRRILPFIVVRGGATDFYTSERPILHGEDYEMTRRMNEVTGVSTVYAVRTARNAIAVYGTARNRTEHDRVYRYANSLLPQLQEGVVTTAAQTTGTPGAANAASTATTTSVSATAPALAAAAGVAPAPGTTGLTNLQGATSPSTGYQAPIHVQMYVRVLDDDASAVRMVSVETSVVEISRNALKNLGTQFGSATLLSETVDGDNGGITREIDPTFNLGEGLLGDFAGFGSFSNINPIRVRLAALMQNGTARVLSKPNLTAVEGADAQIVIGGARPLPSTQTNASGGSTQSSLEFRRFGIILTMRPTVTDDDTIILQIRGDVTELDFTTAITLGGATIPGERVRSVDTTVTIREGDTLVLGGLMTNDLRKQTSKVPILGDIPILGALFRSKRFENNETELAIFMSPRIRRQRASMETGSAVRRVPSLPPLRDPQESRETAFGLGVEPGAQ